VGLFALIGVIKKPAGLVGKRGNALMRRPAQLNADPAALKTCAAHKSSNCAPGVQLETSHVPCEHEKSPGFLF
jgi:hypothetical protein